MKILFTVRDMHGDKKMGGIGNYYALLKNYWNVNIDYFYIGKRYNDTSWVAKRLIIDYRNLIKLLNKYDMIVVNPSLSINSLLRDAISVVIGKIYRIKTIVFFRGWHAYMVNKIEKSWFIRKLFQWVYNRSDVFIVLSKDFKDKLREWGFQQKIYIETTVVDNVLLNGYQKNVRPIVGHNSINILFLARLEKAKGIFEALDIYEIIKQKYPEVRLTIAGDGGQLEDVKNIVEKRNIRDVEFTGYVTGEAKARTFANSDVYIFPSYGEGMPNSVLEAIAFGLPVITRPVGGLRDFFEDGKMGFITESKDPEVFAQLTEKLILNPDLRRQMREYNAQFARKHFLASVVAKRLERIYDDVLNGTIQERTWMDA